MINTTYWYIQIPDTEDSVIDLYAVYNIYENLIKKIIKI